ncbi:MAG TPA: hypothetical protein VIA18_16345, partial [Polyangia bacterium]|nr:hypothetical protein [Polyangia bacterium]
MRRNTMQLGWPFALIGAAVGAQLPSATSSSLTMALVLGIFGVLISSALERVRDWQVALMAPAVGAGAGLAIGLGVAGLDAGVVGAASGIGFGILALPALLLITDGARRALRLPEGSMLGKAQRRRVWLLALSASTLASLMVPALTNPWSQPAEAPLAQMCALGTMCLALIDATIWLVLAQLDPSPPSTPPPSANPYRDPAPIGTAPRGVDMRALAALAAGSPLYDAMLVAVVAAALL